jgi:hypothetical protein
MKRLAGALLTIACMIGVVGCSVQGGDTGEDLAYATGCKKKCPDAAPPPPSVDAGSYPGSHSCTVDEQGFENGGCQVDWDPANYLCKYGLTGIEGCVIGRAAGSVFTSNCGSRDEHPCTATSWGMF